MGASTSDLGQKEVDELVRETNFTPAEIHRLYRRFQRLDKDGSSTLSTDEFLSIPELAMNPLAMCVIARFDRNKTDAVTFKQFCQTLSVFSVKEDKQNKLRFAFDVYDDKGDGYIDREELGLILRLMVRNNLTDEQIKKIVETTISEADHDHDGKISFAEFLEVVEHGALDSKLSIRF
eukprot:TRINITY_DN1120_c0_g1_i1.p2 TRINITY_DN1120_c0_g1~~TRINITY_DN1120_c0_g1_i1.p2  ORF type:complete len:178 (-),score=51.73 TRINITY_DN1120_c0_g1_i1:433-966(-)